jgi:hypothetical protein
MLAPTGPMRLWSRGEGEGRGEALLVRSQHGEGSVSALSQDTEADVDGAGVRSLGGSGSRGGRVSGCRASAREGEEGEVPGQGVENVW